MNEHFRTKKVAEEYWTPKPPFPLLPDICFMPDNLLGRHGMAIYHGPIFGVEDSSRLFDALSQGLAWQQDELFIYGRKWITERRTAWHGDLPYAYTYSRQTRSALPWTEDLSHIKALVEAVTGESFNSCLLNHYPSGKVGMGWHSDDEATLDSEASIASVSLGPDRRFLFKHKRTSEKVEVLLENGSLLVMDAESQRHWLHSLPKMAKVFDPRINLTFRRMLPGTVG